MPKRDKNGDERPADRRNGKQHREHAAEAAAHRAG